MNRVERAVLAGVVLCALFVAWATIFGSLTLATVFGAFALLAAPFGILVRALAREIAAGSDEAATDDEDPRIPPPEPGDRMTPP